MLAYMYKHMLKNNNATASTCLKSTHRYLSHNAQSVITVTRNDDEPVKGLFKKSGFSDTQFSVNVSSKITSIKALFVNYGFSDTQFSKLLKKYPFMLSLNVNIAKSKLDFLHSYGFTSDDLCRILAADAHVIKRSLENCIKPSCEILKGLLKDNQNVIFAVKRAPRTLKQDLTKTLVPNFELLRRYGVPYSRILGILKDQPGTFLNSKVRFKIFVEEIKEMGFHPEKRSFLDAIHLFSAVSESTRERKWDLYRKWGWSDEEILSALRKQPFIMTTSEKKIERVMDFLVNKMGWGVSQVSHHPLVIMHSFENRTMPRCLVVKFLLLKGVLKKDLTLCSFIGLSEENFRKRYVDGFCMNFPEVINLYGGVKDNAQKVSNKVTN